MLLLLLLSPTATLLLPQLSPTGLYPLLSPIRLSLPLLLPTRLLPPLSTTLLSALWSTTTMELSTNLARGKLRLMLRLSITVPSLTPTALLSTPSPSPTTMLLPPLLPSPPRESPTPLMLASAPTMLELSFPASARLHQYHQSLLCYFA